MFTARDRLTEPRQSKCSILVVEDDPSTRELISDILTLAGYSVETASNGAEALRLVEQKSPSLVLLDMNLPVLNGREFAEELRQRGMDIPIVVMTAAEDARPAAEEIDAIDYLDKPFELAEVLDLVDAECKPKRSWWAFWRPAAT